MEIIGIIKENNNNRDKRENRDKRNMKKWKI